MDYLILLPLFLLIGCILLNSFYHKKIKIKKVILFSLSFLIFISSIVFCFLTELDLPLFFLTTQFKIELRVDKLANFLAVPINFIFVLILIFSNKYMDKEQHQIRFYNFYFLTWLAMLLFLFSANLITLYIFFEMISLSSMPLVLHHQTKQSINAAKKYLYYSIGGSFLALFGIIVLYLYGNGDLTFKYGGNINSFNNHSLLCQIGILFILFGFGVKAGLFPFHKWLIAAHPVAPGNASALLSGVITKAGVIAIIRVVYYVVQIDLIQQSFIPYVFLSFSIFSILMGSTLACFEKNLKTRLAYSTISQVSYILSTLLMLNDLAFKGALFHLIAHMLIKVCLFLFAGIMNYQYHLYEVDELEGIGKKDKTVLICFLISSLALIGVPFTIGFVSKWYMATAAFETNIKVFNILLPIMLLISAILTAVYLLPISIKGMISQKEYQIQKSSKWLKVPMIILVSLILFYGIFFAHIEQIIIGIIGK